MNNVILATLKAAAQQFNAIPVDQAFIEYRNGAAARFKTYGREQNKILLNCDYLWLEYNLIRSGSALSSGVMEFDCTLPQCNNVKLELKGLQGKYFNIHPTGSDGYGGIDWFEKNVKEHKFDYIVFWQFINNLCHPLEVGDIVPMHIASVESGEQVYNSLRRSSHEVGGWYYTPKNLIQRITVN